MSQISPPLAASHNSRPKRHTRFIGIRVPQQLFDDFNDCVADLNRQLQGHNLQADYTMSDQVRALMTSFVEHRKQRHPNQVSTSGTATTEQTS